MREFHINYKFRTRGVLLSRTVSLRFDYYQKLLKIRGEMESLLGELVTLSEALALAIELALKYIDEEGLTAEPLLDSLKFLQPPSKSGVGDA